MHVSRHFVNEKGTEAEFCPAVVSGIGNLSKGVFEGRTSTGSENFFLLICLDAIKFVSLSFFTPAETI